MKKIMAIIEAILTIIGALTFWILALCPSLGILKAFCYSVIFFIAMLAFVYLKDKNDPLA